MGDELGSGSDDTGTHRHQLLHGLSGEGLEVDRAKAAGPAHGGVAHICAALGSDQIGVGVGILLGPEVDVLHGHTQICIEALVEVAHEVTGAAVGALPGSDLALLIGELVGKEHMDLLAGDTELIEILHHGHEHGGLRGGDDHDELFVLHGGRLQSVEHVGSEIVVDIDDDLHLEIGILEVFALLGGHVQIGQQIQCFLIKLGQPGAGSKAEFV